MNNTVEFIVKMRDMMSGGLGRLGTTSQSSFSRMTNSAQGAINKNQLLGLSFNELQKKIQATEDTIKNSTIPSQIAAARRELEAMQRVSTRHSGNLRNAGATSAQGGGIGIGGVALGAAFGGIIANAGQQIVGTIGSAITKSMQKEQAITGLTTFLGKDGAQDAYKNIQKDADVTPFDTASLLEVNRSLISAGLGAKDARKDTMNLANAVSAVGGGNDVLSRMAANMQQIKTVGKATAMDIRQFGIAGINIYAMLAKSTGKSIDKVKEMDVSYNDLAKTLAMANAKGGIYEGALAAQSQTMMGRWSTMKDQFSSKLVEIGEALAPVLEMLFSFGGGLISSLQPMIDFIQWMGGATTGASIFLTVLGFVGAGLLTYGLIVGGTSLYINIITAAQWLWNAALTANPIGIVVVAIGALIGGLVVAYHKFDAFRAMLSGVWAALKQVGSNIIDTFTKLPEMVIKAFTQIPAAIKQIFMGVGDLFNAIFGDGKLSDVPKILKSIGGGLIKANPVTGLAAQVFDEATKGAGDAYTKAKNKSLADSKAAKAKKATAGGSALSDNRALAASNASAGESTGASVAGGGPKTINITVGKFFDSLQFTTMNGSESAQELEKVVLECLARVVYNGAKTI